MRPSELLAISRWACCWKNEESEKSPKSVRENEKFALDHVIFREIADKTHEQ
jgi:hypothetical protein